MTTILTPSAIAVAQNANTSGAFALIIVGLLLVLLVYREFLDGADRSNVRQKQIAGALAIGIAPLLIALSIIVVAKIVQVLV